MALKKIPLDDSGALARRTAPDAYLVSCSLDLEAEVRERDNPSSTWVEYEPTGRQFGTFEATIANCIIDSLELIAQPSVFEWPEHRLFIAMQVMHVVQEFSARETARWRAGETRLYEQPATLTRVRGTVLGIARYGPERIDEPEARRRLGMPPKQLTQKKQAKGKG